jgi:hypothetical protein
VEVQGQWLSYAVDTRGLLTVLARVGGFTSSNCNHFNTTVRERSVDKGRPKTGEATSTTSTNVFLHSALFPIAEPSPVMVWSSTKHDDQTSNEQSQDRYNLYGREYEFSFSVNRNSEDVKKDDDDNDDGDPYGRVVPSGMLVVVAFGVVAVHTSLLDPRS